MILLWFRQDLRINDNLALNAALNQAKQENKSVLPIYILDDHHSKEWKMGGASRWWLHHSLTGLQNDLQSHYGLTLHVTSGPADTIIESLRENNSMTAIHWNRCYEPWRINRDSKIKATLKDNNIESHSHNSSFLYEPPKTNKADGTPYKVFTPYYKKGCLTMQGQPRTPAQAPQSEHYSQATTSNSDLSHDITSLGLIPAIKWYKQMEKQWESGETGAHKKLDLFLENHLKNYKENRNHMNMRHTSYLSPHLHFGEISPNQAWHAITQHMIENHCETDGENFLSELGWREFSHNLLYNNPNLPKENIQTKFNYFPWNDSNENNALLRWQRGQTGYPIVDAAMHELWQTGYMHNRARMIVGSFLVKHLRLDWRLGQQWFWDTLLDADLANNSASWQWIAGCGADAAPYFRIFNPITQGQKFDQDGSYTKTYLPELSKLPVKYLFEPWNAPKSVLAQAGIILGRDYPHPIVDHKQARQSALDALASLTLHAEFLDGQSD